MKKIKRKKENGKLILSKGNMNKTKIIVKADSKLSNSNIK